MPSSAATNIHPHPLLTQYRAGGVVLLCPNAPYQLWRIAGPDAASFLQNRTSNDVAALAAAGGHLNAVLDKKAKLEGLFTLAKSPNNPADFWLMVDSAIAETAHMALFQFKLMNDFTVEEQFDWQCIGLHGVMAASQLADVLTDSDASLSLPPYAVTEMKTAAFGELLLCSQPLTGAPGLWIWGENNKIDALQTALQRVENVSPIAVEELSILALEAGLPLVGTDMALGTLLPETGLEHVAASTTKGCYLGQETIARVATYGAVQRALVALALNDKPDNADNPQHWQQQPLTLTDNDKTIGTVNRLFYSPALQQWCLSAYVDKDNRQPGKAITVTVGQSKPLAATVRVLPLVKYQSVEDMLHDGLRAYGENRDADAINLLRQALTMAPQNPDALEALGAVLSRQGQYAEAITLMESLINIEPDRVMAYTNLSVCHMELGDKDAAEDAKAQATVVAMRAQMAKGMQQKANAAEEAARLDAQRKQLENRVQMFHDALAHSPDDPLGNFGLGSTLLELNRYAEAAEALAKTIGLPSSQSAAYLKLGQAYEGDNQLEQARQTYAAGVEVAARRRDLQPLKELEQRLQKLNG